MRGRLLCIPCTVRTAYDVARRSSMNDNVRFEVVMEVLRWLSSVKRISDYTPAELHTRVCRIAREITGNKDPFKDVKDLSNEVAMKVVSLLNRRIEETKSFRCAFRLAVLGTICGNTLDFEVEGYKPSLQDLEKILLRCLNGSFYIDEIDVLMKLLSRSRKVMYLLDNAGEIVFDKVLIELILKHFSVELWAIVKEGPVLNDATMIDAVQVGLTDIVNVTTTGNDHIGLNMEETSDNFRLLLKEADLIIAKGQGYFESIPEVKCSISAPVCYILRTKCRLVAEALGAPLQENIVKIEIGEE